jgi:Fe-S-cluster-containing hydrogenase component 2
MLDKEWCIGCGVCAVPSPTSAVKLVRKSDIINPRDFKELHREILKERKPAVITNSVSGWPKSLPLRPPCPFQSAELVG